MRMLISSESYDAHNIMMATKSHASQIEIEFRTRCVYTAGHLIAALMSEYIY